MVVVVERVAAAAAVGLELAVEAAVAVAGSALEGVGFGGHELAAAVEHVAADGRGVVAEALAVPDEYCSGLRARRSCSIK